MTKQEIKDSLLIMERFAEGKAKKKKKKMRHIKVTVQRTIITVSICHIKTWLKE